MSSYESSNKARPLLAKAYNPSEHESDIYDRWEKSGAFTPDGNKAIQKSDANPFSIIMPPPNANGNLHTGHAMFVIEDIMTRYRRMQGQPTLWLPGTDHAGIETQVVYERELKKDGLSRFDLGRDKFYAAALEFTVTNRPKIISQLRSLGFSADWSRLKFTLDEDIIATIYATFKQMHADGLIYRGNRIVNWCTSCQSSFADIEVKFVDRTDEIYTLDYGTVKIATTRPETIFADAAVAVHPDDVRYAKLIGQTATIPLIDRPVAIISDDYVAQEFGTGALKVTPAHDKNDYEIGKRHHLPEISVVDLDGKLINVPDEFAGVSVKDGRQAVVTALEAAGKLIKTTPIAHSVGTHDRCGTTIEPLITEQWFMRVAEPNAKVIQAIESGEIKIIPERFKKVAIDWLANEYDWNISRQNWFGIRIPVFYKASSDPDKEPYIVTADENEAKAYYGEGNYRAETDVFDTWYSSGQWPYATLQSTGDFDRFYPTIVMETGRDILTKWVTKMAMFSLYRTGQIPFTTVYLHGMVNDEHGKKMSKSKGNVINPLDLTSKYGTDALRLALTIGITPGNDGSLGEAKVEGYRNFCNKLWNVARFVLGQLPEGYSPTDPQPKTAADAWILARVNAGVSEVTRAIEDYRFSEAGQIVYSLLWNDFADWYIEASKVEQNANILYHSLMTILKLLHPIAPYVTEAIWDASPATDSQLITSAWPQSVTITAALSAKAAEFEAIQAVVSAARTLTAEEQLSKPTILTTDKTIASSAELVTRLARAGKIELVEQGRGLYLGTATPAWIDADDSLIEARKHRLQSTQIEKEGYLKSLEAKLANERYTSSAPASVVEETRTRRDETAAMIAKLNEQLQTLVN
ncbi:valine--tRNA ligase [Candidatus Saccharibacteria bacterium]|nr:valine--tRNA ligase [Candidatus Saccharibacteria bacterium]